MRLATIIFARMDSRRLPGKSLVDLNGRPLLHYVVARAKRARCDVIVATSDRAVDEPIVSFARTEGVPCFRGSADDVAGRALACAEQHGLDAIVRISGDSPFIDPELIDQLAGSFVAGSGSIDIATNTFPRTYPPGLSVEVISRSTLRKVTGETQDREDREHVTRYIYAKPDRFRIRNCPSDVRYDPGLQLTVDDPNDLDRARWMVSEGADADAPLKTIIRLAQRYRDERADRARTSGHT
jgi:spore coat polysaccharide biosynthesis protein SpsF